MNKTPRLSKSGIEYLNYSWGIWSGCRNIQAGICPVTACWAKGIALRYPLLYPNGFEPTYYPEAIDSPKYLKKPSIIGTGWVGDVIGYGLEYKEQIYSTIKTCPQHTFLFLTKNADKLFSWQPFPDNCRVGVTATDTQMALEACHQLEFIETPVKYLSIEPMFDAIKISGKHLKQVGINQVIIGAQTKPYKPPKIEWVQEIVEACDKAGIPVFLKDNLAPLFGNMRTETDVAWGLTKECGYYCDISVGHVDHGLRQEVPSGSNTQSQPNRTTPMFPM